MDWSGPFSAAEADRQGRGANAGSDARWAENWLGDGFTPAQAAKIRRLAVEAAEFSGKDGASRRSTAPLRELSRLLYGRAPYPWAAVQYTLGCRLREAAEKVTGTAQLHESARTFKSALQVFTWMKSPNEWAMIQRSLGDVLLLIGRRSRGLSALIESADAYRAALRVYVRNKESLDWVKTQEGLADALHAKGLRESRTSTLRQAVSAYSAALQYHRTLSDEHRLALQEKFAAALVVIGERENNIAWFEVAAGVYRAMGHKDRFSVKLAAELNRAQVLLRVIQRTRNVRRLDGLRAEIMALKTQAEHLRDMEWVRDTDMMLAQIEVMRWKLNPYF